MEKLIFIDLLRQEKNDDNTNRRADKNKIRS